MLEMSHWEEHDDFLARWLSDELSPEEKAEFENSAEGKEYARMIQAADQLSAPAYDVHGELSKLKNKIHGASEQKETKTIWMQPVFRYAVAASVTALVVVAYFILRSPLTTVITAPGQQEIVLLPDGSEVKMNAASLLSFNEDTWEEKRELTLEGEAFFQVMKGSSFTVNTDYGAVTVLGTSFNVRTRGDKLEVVCYTGKVNVTSSNADKDLLPGDGVRIERGAVTSTWQKPEAEEPDWMQGMTVFGDPGVPLAEAIEELSNIFGIAVKEESYPDTLIFRGTIPHSNVEAALKIVMGTNQNFLRYEYDPENNTLSVLSIDQ